MYYILICFFLGLLVENQVPTVAADTRLDHRWIDLRTPANQAIFKIQSAVCKYFRDNLASKVRLCVDGMALLFCATVKSCSLTWYQVTQSHASKARAMW